MASPFLVTGSLPIGGDYARLAPRADYEVGPLTLALALQADADAERYPCPDYLDAEQWAGLCRTARQVLHLEGVGSGTFDVRWLLDLHEADAQELFGAAQEVRRQEAAFRGAGATEPGGDLPGSEADRLVGGGAARDG